MVSEKEIPSPDMVLPEVEVLTCKFTEQRSFRTTMQKAQSPRLVKETTQFYSMQTNQDPSHHLKFNSNQDEIYLRTNRAKLPQIGRNSIEHPSTTTATATTSAIGFTGLPPKKPGMNR